MSLVKYTGLAKYALAITTGAALLAGCSSSGASSLAPSGSTGMSGIGHIGRVATINGLMVTAEHPNLGVRIVPMRDIPTSPDAEKHHKAPAEQFIANFANGTIDVFEYPHKLFMPGPISGISAAQGECANVLFGTGKKTFWVTSSLSSGGGVAEFEVSSRKEIATLAAPSGDIPVGCAIDPSTGNLITTNINNGKVTLYKDAKGTGTDSQSPLIEAFFGGFDKSGNLYVDGFNSGSSFGFVELPKNKAAWVTLSGASVEFPGEVQFDGKYIAINDQTAHDIFGYACSGSSCTLKRTVSLSGASDCDQTWIAKKYVICPDAGNNVAEIFKYPAGGSIIATLTGSYLEPLAAVQAEK